MRIRLPFAHHPSERVPPTLPNRDIPSLEPPPFVNVAQKNKELDEMISALDAQRTRFERAIDETIRRMDIGTQFGPSYRELRGLHDLDE